MSTMIKAVNLGIKFRLGRYRRNSIRRVLLQGQEVNNNFWALRNVTFSLGQSNLGIIGVNGSGKSTLLRIIGGIYLPDEGTIEVEGKTSTQFTLGLGFLTELSGIDNIYLSGALLGLSQTEIHNTIHSIIDFADIGDFINLPVRIYSTGMQARLGFAIATHTHREIILIDEILGVGDRNFQAKCKAKIHEITSNHTIILVSHNVETIREYTDKTLWLDKGQIVTLGNTEEVIKAYVATS